jgi:hypothetical protein
MSRQSLKTRYPGFQARMCASVWEHVRICVGAANWEKLPAEAAVNASDTASDSQPF